jgi:hypothetical protein
VPAVYNEPLQLLTGLRNAFSHGKLIDLDLKKAMPLFSSLRTIAPALNTDGPPGDSPGSILMVALGIIWFGLAQCEQDALIRRERVETALARLDSSSALDAVLAQLAKPSG